MVMGGVVDLKKYHCAGCGLMDFEDNLSFFVYPVKPKYPWGFYLHKDRPLCKQGAALRLGIDFPPPDPVI